MDRNKQVRIHPVRDRGTVIEGYGLVLVASEDDFDPGTFRLDLVGKHLGDIKGEGFFIGFAIAADGSGVGAAVAGIYDYGGQAQVLGPR